MNTATTGRRRIKSVFGVICVTSIIVGFVGAAIFDMTFEDFHLAGTQVGDIAPGVILTSNNCRICHGEFDEENDPYSTWSGSLMGQAGRDPLFFAQMTAANQDVANVGYFCMRCHVPLSFVTEAAYTPDGSALGIEDVDGVNCHFCHSMVDPIYKPGISPIEDLEILSAMDEVPEYYGNAMFVLDPQGRRRGPRSDALPPHEFIQSEFHSTGAFCGTCHDVGNVAVTKQLNGTYRYNLLDMPPMTEDLWEMFPLERTYTEWKLSAFNNGGVDMGGLFGGEGATVIESCQDCHMPKAAARTCSFGPDRPDARRHEFAGAGAQVLDIIAAHTQGDPDVDQASIARARAASVSMLERAATLEGDRLGGRVRVRVTNQSGHKLPTGHIEGRRVWVNVKFLDGTAQLVGETGHYDMAEAHLEEEGTTIFEMHVGLSDDAASATGLPPGTTVKMALADTIMKDNRIPPRGWDNAIYELGGAPSVGEFYADGQHWHDSWYPVPASAVKAEVTVYYQNTPRHYIEALRDANVTDHWGDTLHSLWEDTGRGAPIPMVSTSVTIGCLADLAAPKGQLDFSDVVAFLTAFSGQEVEADFAEPYGVFDFSDIVAFLSTFGAGCP